MSFIHAQPQLVNPLPAAGHRYQGDVWSTRSSKDGVLGFGVQLHPADHLHLQAGGQGLRGSARHGTRGTPPGGHRSREIPAREAAGGQHGALESLVSFWLQTGESLVSFRFQTGEGLVSFWLQTGEGLVSFWLQTGEGLVSFQLQTGEGLVSFRLQTGEGLVSFRLKTGERLVSFHFD